MATTIELPDGLAERIERAVEDSKKDNYVSKTEFVRECVRRELDEYWICVNCETVWGKWFGEESRTCKHPECDAEGDTLVSLREY